MAELNLTKNDRLPMTRGSVGEGLPERDKKAASGKRTYALTRISQGGGGSPLIKENEKEGLGKRENVTQICPTNSNTRRDELLHL